MDGAKKVLSYGINYPDHAEKAAIDNLKKKRRIERKKRKSFTTVNILVIRFNKTGNLTSSKPCVHCIHDMLNLSDGYRIKYVYYSEMGGIILKKKLTDLVKDPNMHMSKHHRNMGHLNPLTDLPNMNFKGSELWSH